MLRHYRECFLHQPIAEFTALLDVTADRPKAIGASSIQNTPIRQKSSLQGMVQTKTSNLTKPLELDSYFHYAQGFSVSSDDSLNLF
jgi:hypothetical protein